MKHQVVEPSLQDFQPPSSAASAPADESPGSARGPEWSYSGLSRPEELAVPPQLSWTDDHREQIERAYYEFHKRFLEEGERYQIEWPPWASLAGPGQVYWTEGDVCSVHEDEYSDDCEECQQLERITEVVEPAIWEWYATVNKYSDVGGGSEALEDSDQWMFMRSEVDPREVGYREGPWG